ncbi:3-deoxy-manno-octulosonate cytidylyltransferase [Leptospira borgpetersenii]|uniref:3-deoxy-manno-octulosonate cytidylyltransferase n=1 Tax=Leptospira borgpetersenii serovar Hardjo-bovis (strain JB197) TaxID=355277 RepID=Q04TL5_LEPBJ|nr:3-deoxy-manno-octulosonate cytidylyltransferase [Leptospira borgpetersenii]ABJ75755.1 3-deoxy-manno-octulosonate cytidylyltransferase [Leptospira borgpetersenii serovar Hardjo-bovis str. JB197]ABJ78699.1 3-deoxy-manno-octulosonate cytidylyltransferase [Leptospira borgpetersenii serovar Hardjo-bovis str. L550]AMX57988.1 3-deoxy-manno-octulosonate cytidylyltransferase [Leptospira borgpetersenii serovar Hardjo]AMX61219.1 3-deoxy-manno-octulosonate cytidylyltransferase [Leptospira borgpetersenii
MKTIAVLPARMASSRFPDKPLVKISGLEMIEHVRRRVEMSSSVDKVVVATCDEIIKQRIESFGGKAVMTSDVHRGCIDRVAEAALYIKGDIVIVVQGDEPLILPAMLDDLVKPILNDSSIYCTNLVTKIVDEEEFQSPNAPKVVVDKNWDLLYASREPIPSRKKYPNEDYLKLKQLGVIAFRNDFLQTFAALAPTPLEIIESVDMNRAIEHGYKVRMVLTEGVMIGVDVPGDVSRVESVFKTDLLLSKYLS